jgi:SRSO17 transposase
MRYCQIDVQDVKNLTEKLSTFTEHYREAFQVQTHNVVKKAEKYLHGQLGSRTKGNLNDLARAVPQTNGQELHHFVANSPWDDEEVRAQIQADLNEVLGAEAEKWGILDESGFPKQGAWSAGVKRQYCGNLGKVENCQVGVYVGVATHGGLCSLADVRLYLPKEWCDNSGRRARAGVPGTVDFQTKAELGVEMLKGVRKHLQLAWVNGDGFYGEQPALLDTLEQEGVQYCFDIPCDTRVYLAKPAFHVPPRRHMKGPTPTRIRATTECIRVDHLARHLPPTDYQRVEVRDSSRGPLVARFSARRVWRQTGKAQEVQEVWLIIRRTLDEPKTRYQFCNADAHVACARLVQMSYGRYWVERSLEDGKHTVGLGAYEVRGWRGWQHHQTLCLLAMLFLLQLKRELGSKAPLLSMQDAKALLEVALPHQQVTPELVLQVLEDQHRARDSAKQSHTKTCRKKLKEQERM